MKTNNSKFKVIILYLLCLILAFNTFTMQVYATQDELDAEAEERKNEPVDTNEIEGWPQGPKIGAEGAILMDANTGAILYAKNIDERLYPASTTKIMTSLVALENCNLNDIVTVHQSAIDANASDGSNMGLYAGEQLTLEEILYGILINSANEGCNAVAEHISGSIDNYVDLMNKRAKELGLKNTHFVSANGLHDDNHYTSPRDLAIIAREFFSHDVLCRMSSTPKYVIHETANHREHYLNSHNKLLSGMDYEYQYLVGSKTGFTSNSRQTLVSCAEKDGMKLICVIMKEETPNQFTDTVALFNYGFDNFTEVNIKNTDTRYQLSGASYLQEEDGYFGNTMPLTEVDNASYVTLPDGVAFEQLDSEITYNNTAEGAFASISYSYKGQKLGAADIKYSESLNDTSDFSKDYKGPKVINIKTVLFRIVEISALMLVLISVLERLRKVYLERKRLAKIRRSRKSSSSRGGFSKRRRPVHHRHKKW